MVFIELKWCHFVLNGLILNFLFCKGPHSGETSSSKADDYDIAVRQLAFELKGKVSVKELVE